MFKVIISDTTYHGIISAEEQKSPSARSNLYNLLNQQPVQVITAVESDKYKSAPEKVLNNPSALYILDISYAEALSIQKTYGVMCLSGSCPDISPLVDVNDIYIAQENVKLGRGWDTILDSIEELPSNALLLTDRYLFAFRRPDAGDGVANIHDILDELLPQQFYGGNYHVTIIFDNMAKHATYTFDEITQKLEEVKQKIKRDYPITMEVLGITPECRIYYKLHNRMIISNYYMVEAAHKLAAFNEDKGTARQLLVPMALFTESSINGQSTPPLDAINQTLTTLRDFSKSLQKLPESVHSTYLYAVNGKRRDKCMSIINHLLK